MRYHTLVYDSARWDGFAYRPGDIVISTPPKCGTTWTQMLCALLIFDGPDFPAPLGVMSPWLDMCNRRLDDVLANLGAQTHRRFIKTHTPLDGIPIDEQATYLVVGRDPRDVAISYEYHRANMDFDHFLELRASAVGLDDLSEVPERPPVIDDPVERFRSFIESDVAAGPPTLEGILHHLDTAWARRHGGNVWLFHYADFTADLVGEIRRLAKVLGIELSETRAAELAAEASLDRMRARAAEVAPSADLSNWKDTKAFFRIGGFGEWREQMTDDLTSLYDARVAALASPELAAWAHAGHVGSGIDPATV